MDKGRHASCKYRIMKHMYKTRFSEYINKNILEANNTTIIPQRSVQAENTTFKGLGK